MGIIAAAGMARIAKMILILRDYEDHRPKRGSCGVD